MILRVPDDFKGSFVLSTLEKACWAGMQIVVSGNDLYAPDIKAAIKKKMLVPFIKGEYDEYADTNHEVLIVNRTNRKLVLGKIVLNPKAALPIERSLAESSIIQGAESDDLISIISDDDSFQNKNDFFEDEEEIEEEEDIEEENIEDEDESIEEENIIEDNIVEEVREQEEEIFEGKISDVSIYDRALSESEIKEMVKQKKEEEKKVKTIEPVEHKQEEDKTIAKVWNMREQKIEEAEMVNKISDQVIIKADEKEKEEKKKSIKNKKAKKKKISKKKKIKKKKGKKKKKKNVKTIEPVGEVREKGNVAIELDSRGNPIGKPSDVLNHLIDEVQKNISFVDEEQKKERAKKRGVDVKDWDWEN